MEVKATLSSGQNGTKQLLKEKDQYASFSDNPRLLVQFEKDVKSLGLECHNNVENSLWILESDLKKL